SPVGSPAVIAQMLDFVVQHDIECETEHFSFDQVNEAVDRSRSGDARYRVVLSR
ncbi:MAG: alcohol dehydrogenase, partial [Pseudomonadota bacterium]|nr:alcohol dehydrogenase [Pseudomonadota bacterium]